MPELWESVRESPLGPLLSVNLFSFDYNQFLVFDMFIINKDLWDDSQAPIYKRNCHVQLCEV